MNEILPCPVCDCDSNGVSAIVHCKCLAALRQRIADAEKEAEAQRKRAEELEAYMRRIAEETCGCVVEDECYHDIARRLLAPPTEAPDA